MSGEYSILSDVIPNIATLELFLSKIGQGDGQGVQTAREELLRALRTRFLSPEAEALNVMHEKEYAVADTRGGKGGRKPPPPPIIFIEALVLKSGSTRKFSFQEVEPCIACYFIGSPLKAVV